MKVLFLFGTLFVVVLANAQPSSSRDQDEQNRRRLQSLINVQVYEDQDTNERVIGEQDNNKRGIDRSTASDVYPDLLRSAHLDVLAQQMDVLASYYGGQGRVRVSYVPPSGRAYNGILHDLGSLNFKYIPPKQTPHSSGLEQNYYKQQYPSEYESGYGADTYQAASHLSDLGNNKVRNPFNKKTGRCCRG